ncbi:MAG: hypothetical protein M0R22_00325 [Dehalococcoidia bacterium]|jgi:hypothetical protein|nr:hypothetical protein [Dehalococcoidia bacterium]
MKTRPIFILWASGPHVCVSGEGNAICKEALGSREAAEQHIPTFRARFGRKPGDPPGIFEFTVEKIKVLELTLVEPDDA